MPGKTLLRLVLFFGFLVSSSVFSASMSGPRKITEIGCHAGDNTCFVGVDGAVVGPASCSGVSIRWDSSSSAGKNQLSLLMAAYMAGKSVNFYILDGCYSAQTTYPTFGYSVVK